MLHQVVSLNNLETAPKPVLVEVNEDAKEEKKEVRRIIQRTKHIAKETNLAEHPGFHFPQEEGVTQITLGDLHGSGLKLLNFLVTHGAMHLSQNDYDTFVKIYKAGTESLTKQHLTDLQALLDRAIIFDIGVIRLIGDELCDRGENDYFVLKLLEKLGKEGSKVEILFSNHGGEFIYDFEDGMTLNTQLNYGQGQSIQNLSRLVRKGLVTREEVQNLVKQYYHPTLKVVSYSLCKKQDANSQDAITIFTHAPCGIETIAALAEHFEVDYHDETVDALAATIDKINEKFNTLVREQKLKETNLAILGEKGITSLLQGVDTSDSPEAVPLNNPLARVSWNNAEQTREWNYRTGRYGQARDVVYTPEEHQNYQMKFVHGHRLDFERSPDRINLDANNFVGRPGYDSGTLNIAFSTETAAPISSEEFKIDDRYSFYRQYAKTDTSKQDVFNVAKQNALNVIENVVYYREGDINQLTELLKYVQTLEEKLDEKSIQACRTLIQKLKSEPEGWKKTVAASFEIILFYNDYQYVNVHSLMPDSKELALDYKLFSATALTVTQQIEKLVYANPNQAKFLQDALNQVQTLSINPDANNLQVCKILLTTLNETQTWGSSIVPSLHRLVFYVEHQHATTELNLLRNKNITKEKKDLIDASLKTMQKAKEFVDKGEGDLAILHEIIKKNRQLAINPTRKLMEECRALAEKVKGKPKWGYVIGGLLLAVLGIVGIASGVAAIPATAVTAKGLTIAGSAALFAGGSGMTYYGRRKDLSKDVSKSADKAEVEMSKLEGRSRCSCW